MTAAISDNDTAEPADGSVAADATVVSCGTARADESRSDAARSRVPAAGRDTAPPAPRLVPVPQSDPPFDDEGGPRVRLRSLVGPGPGPGAGGTSRAPGRRDRAAPRRDVPGATAPPAAGGPRVSRGPLGRPGSRPAARPPARRPHGAVTRPAIISAESVPGWSREMDMGVRMTASAALPPAERAATAMVRALLEVLSGTRALAQLRAHCAPDVFAGLGDAPMLGGRGVPHLLTTRVCEPADGVAEVSAVFRRSERVRAMALRLQGVDGRWRITALQMG